MMAFNTHRLTPEQERRLAALPGKRLDGSGRWAALQSVHGSVAAPLSKEGADA